MGEPMSPILTVRELAEWLNVHPSCIYRLLKTGQLRSIRIGSDHRFVATEIEKWMAGKTVKPPVTAPR
jgi:excisionase family DNA binding protein